MILRCNLWFKLREIKSNDIGDVRSSITDILYTFVMGKSQSFKSLNLKFFDFRFCVELPILAKRQSMKYINMGSFERKRLKGKKKVNEFKDGFLILIGMLTLFFKKN